MSDARFDELYERYADGVLSDGERAEFQGLLENPAYRARLVRHSTFESAVSEELKLVEVPADRKPSSRTLTKVGSRRIPIVASEPMDEAQVLGRIGLAAAAAVLVILVYVFVTTKSEERAPIVVRPRPDHVAPKDAPAPEEAPKPVVAPRPPLPAPIPEPQPAPRESTPASEPKPAIPEPPAPPPVAPPKAPVKPTPVEPTRESTTFVATLDRVSGAVAVGTEPGLTGKGIASGRSVATGRGGYAALKFPDGTRLELGSETTLSRVLDGPAGKSAHLDHGMLLVDAVKQPPGRPLVVATAHAESTVLGTQFILSTAAGFTRLDVREGRVKFTRLPQAVSSVVVREGYYAVAGAAGDPVAKPGIGLWKAPPSGLQTWLRADQGVKLNGTTVAAWLDQSPAGNTALQDKPGAQPAFVASALAGRPALKFDGLDDYFTLPDGFNDFRAGLTAFVVVRPGPGGAWSRFLDLDVGPQCENIVFGRKDAPDKLAFWVYANSATKGKVEAPGVVVAGEVQSFCALLNPGGRVTLYKNGGAVAAGDTSMPKTTTRKPNAIAKSNSGGGDPLFRGELFEILLYNRALSEAERVYVESYLNAKYFDATTPPATLRPSDR